VKPIAVGRFEQQDVGLADGRGIRKDRPAVAAEIAAEQNRLPSYPDPGVRGAQQMSGVDELDLETRNHRHGTVVADRLQSIEGAGGVDFRVERLRGDVFRVAMLIRLPRVLLLNVRRIRKHERAQVARARRTKDAAAKALADQSRKVTAVIEMRVRENDGIDLRGGDRQRGPVTTPQLFETLKKSAIDQNPMVAEIEQMF
jgi:hypothetical protein